MTGRSALEELRRILGLLRDDDTQGPSLAPAPGIADLGELAEVVRAAGTPVSLAVTGDVAALPPAAALTVYRIIQEALTNVVKHAGGAAASVRVAAGRTGCRIAVTDNGRGAGQLGGGQRGRPAGAAAARDRRHAGTGGGVRRHAGRGAGGGRRVPGDGVPAGARPARGRAAGRRPRAAGPPAGQVA